MKRKRFDLPPTYFITSLILILLLHSYLPLTTIVESSQVKLLGLVLLFTGFGLILWGANTFRFYETPIRPFEPPTYLIQSGLFSYTRNPIYLGMVIVLFGSVIFLGSLSPLAVIPGFVYVMHHRFIKKEERHLEETFGDYYREYKERVRRWI